MTFSTFKYDSYYTTDTVYNFYGVNKHYQGYGISVIILTNGVVVFSISILKHKAIFNHYFVGVLLKQYVDRLHQNDQKH